MFKISQGVVQTALKVVVYGPEGIGKSTFASQFPEPLFIDTEGSTNHMNVKRLENPSSWEMLKQEISYVRDTKGICNTLVIDTIDWAEQLCVEHICAKHNKTGIEDFGYGNGYVYVKEELGRFLNLLNDLIDRGINIVLTAHAQIRKFEQPDELGAYDRYELKLGKKTSSQTSPLVKEWADMVLFANYKTISVATDKDGKKHKAQGGRRVMYTVHHPCWDAKNRQGLPDEMNFDYAGIAHLFNKAEPQPVQKEEPKLETPPQEPTPELQLNDHAEPQIHTIEKELDQYEGLPKALVDLMKVSNITEEMLRTAVFKRYGYYTMDTPVKDYEPEFIEGCLIGAWNQVVDYINKELMPW